MPYSFFLLIISASLAVFANMIFSEANTIGDTANYFRAYQALSVASITNSFSTFTSIIGATEPLAVLFFYVGAQVISFETQNIILNSLLIYAICLYLRRYKFNLILSLPLVITNFYILVIGFSHLRLKIAIIFSFFYYLTNKRYLLYASVLSHYQTLFIWVNEVLFVRSNLSWAKLVKLLFIIVGLTIYFLFFSNIRDKVAYYFEFSAWKSFPYKTLILVIFSFAIVKSHQRTVVMAVIMCGGLMVVGDGRLNILYTLMLLHEFVSAERRTILGKLCMSAILIYLSVKGIVYGYQLNAGRDFFLLDSWVSARQ